MELTSWLIGGGGIAAFSGLLGAVINHVFGLAKSRADVDRSKAETAQVFNQLAADFAGRNAIREAKLEARVEKLVTALDNLADAVDRTLPLLQRLAALETTQEAMEKIADLRKMNLQARLAM